MIFMAGKNDEAVKNPRLKAGASSGLPSTESPKVIGLVKAHGKKGASGKQPHASGKKAGAKAGKEEVKKPAAAEAAKEKAAAKMPGALDSESANDGAKKAGGAAAHDSKAPAKKKEEKKSRKVAVKRSAKVLADRKKMFGKNGTPTFRGRFGKRNIRRKSIAKWDKWRVPRGIDVQNEKDDGFRPGEGYRGPRSIRAVHPSGFREFMVKTAAEIEKVPENHAIRIQAGIGRRKKVAMVDKAISMGIKVLNP